MVNSEKKIWQAPETIDLDILDTENLYNYGANDGGSDYTSPSPQ